MHIPVLAEEVMALLSPRAGGVYVDATAGLGGHAAMVAGRLGRGGIVVLNDVDPGNLRAAEARVRGAAPDVEVRTVRGNFAEMPARLGAMGVRADMVLADLGFSSNQVEDPSRGLSFQREGPLDMRLDPTLERSALELVSGASEGELARIIAEFGEDREAGRIARKLVAARAREPITTTQRLAEVVRSVFGRKQGGIDPATRTFQALRIAVNDEIGCLEAFLSAVGRGTEEGGWLREGARVAVISFHSLEDRPVKRAFAGLVERGLAESLTRRAVRAGVVEEGSNPRARSAKLRAVRVLGPA